MDGLEDLFRLLGKEKKRAGIVARLAPDEIETIVALNADADVWQRKKNDLDIQKEELVLRRNKWWAAVTRRHKLDDYEQLQYDKAENVIYEMK